MTQPYPTPGPSPSPSAGPSPIPQNPDGTPQLQAAAPSPGRTTIWNMPSELDPTKNLWFDIGHQETMPAPRGGITNEAAQAQAGHRTSVPTSYEILQSPDKIYKQFAALSVNDPAQFVQIQLALASGPFGHVNVNGSFDGLTQAALGKALLQYIQLSHGAGVGMSFTDYLTHAAATAQSLDPNSAANQHLTLADPAQIRDAAQQAAMDELGHGLTQKQLDAFVTRFQQNQIANSADAYTQQMKLPAESAAYVQQTDPNGFKANQRQAYMSSLVNLLGGNLTSRPNQQVAPAVTPETNQQ